MGRQEALRRSEVSLWHRAAVLVVEILTRPVVGRLVPPAVVEQEHLYFKDRRVRQALYLQMSRVVYLHL
jgi:hypothetical protein